MKAIIVVLGLSWALAAQDRITVPFSDPSRPKTVKASAVQGCFTVEGYDGKDVIIEPRGGRGSSEHSERPPRGAEGMRRIDPGASGFTAEEDNNTIRIHTPPNRGGDFMLRVPYSTSLKVECMNGGEIKVNHVQGDLELQNLNGAVTATNVSGSMVAHSLNGRVVVTMDQVTPDRPMSFSSLNGDVDVTLPGDTRGSVKMKSDNGEIYSDFDIQLKANASAPVVEDGRAKGGKYRVKVDRTTTGTINGGGPEIAFKTFNGNIYIRKKK